MTNTVVLSDEMTVLVQPDNNTIITSVPTTTTIVTGQLGPRGRDGSASVSNLGDVDISTLQMGSLLVYNTSVNKWVSTTQLSQQNIDCGEF